MTLPKTFKRAVFKEAGGPLVVEQTEMISPGPNELLIKVEACGVCYSDKYAQYNAMGGGFPVVPGHEIIGRVASVGSAVSGWEVGDRAGGPWHGGHDGTCLACKKGLFQMCDNQAINGITRNGGYAEYCTLRAEAVVRVPEHIPAVKYAPILCAGVTVFNGMRQMNIPVGATVAVQGLGGLGHLAIQYANKFGYRVVALSRDSKKEQFARGLGAHEYIDESQIDAATALQKMGGASLIVSTVPSAEAVTPLLKGLGVKGKLLILSVPGEVSIDTLAMLRYGLSIHSWPSGHARDSEDAIAFTELENINCMAEAFPLEKANEAYETMLKGTVRFRAVITMQ